MDYINYKNKNYPILEINLPEFGYVTIATDTLKDALLNEDYSYKSEEAQAVDEKIFFFVEEEKINLSVRELREYFASLPILRYQFEAGKQEISKGFRIGIE